LFLLAACGGSKSSPTAPTNTSAANTTTTPAPTAPTPPPSATIAFYNSPIDTSAIEYIAPLGNLSPPGHNVPTNHIYFYNRLNNPSAPASVVVAPAAGTVSQITSHGSDAKIEVQATGWRYYLDHIVLDAATVQGETLSAGQRVGMTGTAAYAIDFGLVNPSVTLAFANPARYYDEFINADDPLKFFNEPLKTTLYGLVHRIAADKDGKVCYDATGRLIGSWFVQGVAVSDTFLPQNNAKQLAFVYSSYDGTSIRISIGGTLAMNGLFGVQSGATDPANVSTGSDKVTYQLYATSSNSGTLNGGQAGLLIVQMTDDSTIRVEAFATSTETNADFDSNAVVYTR
jgi:hypothetical protein